LENFILETYETKSGRKPVEEYLATLKMKDCAKVKDKLIMLEERGNSLREPLSKHLDDGIFELRVKTSSGATRIFYFFYLERRIILLNAFTKKSQKTPRSELSKAKLFRTDFILRKGNEDGDF